MKKQEAITQVNECISSVFSKEDVIKLIEQIEETTLDEQLIEDVLKEFNNKMYHIEDDIVDYSSAEFHIGYDNKLELECVSIDRDLISDQLERVFKDITDKMNKTDC
jgi:hypothetical protein